MRSRHAPRGQSPDPATGNCVTMRRTKHGRIGAGNGTRPFFFRVFHSYLDPLRVLSSSAVNHCFFLRPLRGSDAVGIRYPVTVRAEDSCYPGWIQAGDVPLGLLVLAEAMRETFSP